MFSPYMSVHIYAHLMEGLFIKLYQYYIDILKSALQFLFYMVFYYSFLAGCLNNHQLAKSNKIDFRRIAKVSVFMEVYIV